VADADPLSSALARYRTVHREVLYKGARVCDSDRHRWPCDASRMLDALEEIAKLHTEAVIEDMRPPKFRYCSRCSGHPAWPCPEVQAIIAALTGEEADREH
jgi:hypothetical protein